MDNALTGKMSQKGQVVIPAAIRKALGLKKGTEVSFEVKDNEIHIKKLPTALDWADLVKEIPVEDVKIDENGHYDPKKYPDFHDWMVNG
ncbi:AbrB/MazE/SpoVT family DNA-binding domain-containing protein [Limosilactobacillus reuteri]|jgi:AbrB family looped-hinge helix DNA binding protein|uniref:AbrB/MazE/SpoVT family DNA-binding domain-containing protein n=1 Tax=Limosilactobacillus reuteri TaxID=1598 RepID=UPI001C3FAA52|nr:AbrB/MazE/SpoVT family DNA-binding domain-containing protein [Limosilactobacillus reuteri]MCC4399350.1 AbrB/MazE/SpoVT family DNA-binding domain-containing protein [Limosilactobacillus reuteri]MCC4403391.1 AbrB/MazE/SpoVT family DNA-binding domain-containing protein [Limosilactobacillus reuteri]